MWRRKKNKKRVVKRHLKKKGEVIEPEGVEGKKTHVMRQQRSLEMLSEAQGCEIGLGRSTSSLYSMKNPHKFICIFDRPSLCPI